MEEESFSANRDALCIFVKAPLPGLVKTRLAASVGNELAALFYRKCAETVIRQVASLPGVTTYLFYSRAQDRADIEDWLALSGVHLVVQMEDLDLGRRMEHAMQHAFGCGHQRVVVIGTDVPDLTGSLVDRALLALDRNQGVFGPAVDGGYYLLALSILPPGLFQGIRWSTPAALADTLNNACRLGMHVAPLETLETLPDIDTLQDLQEWCNSKQRTLQHGRQLEPQLQHQQQEVEGCSLLDVSFQVAGCRELTRR